MAIHIAGHVGDLPLMRCLVEEFIARPRETHFRTSLGFALLQAAMLDAIAHGHATVIEYLLNRLPTFVAEVCCWHGLVWLLHGGLLLIFSLNLPDSVQTYNKSTFIDKAASSLQLPVMRLLVEMFEWKLDDMSEGVCTVLNV